ncbi:hypothetical protein FRC05_008611, partial [Tulasnella sp. 425]
MDLENLPPADISLSTVEAVEPRQVDEPSVSSALMLVAGNTPQPEPAPVAHGGEGPPASGAKQMSL